MANSAVKFSFFLRRRGVWLSMLPRNDVPRQTTGRRIRRALFLGLFCLALLACLGWLALDLTAKRDLTRYERRWEAKGEHFKFADFVPNPVPAAQNFALTPIVASSYDSLLDTNGHLLVPQNTNAVNRLYMPIYGNGVHYPTNASWDTTGGNWEAGTKTDLKAWQRYYRALAAKTNEFPVPSRAGSPAADVLLALSKYDPVIKELRQAAALPDSRFPSNYDSKNPYHVLLVPLGTLQQCCLVLQLRASAELQNGQSNEAAADVKLMFRLIASIRTEPFMVSQQTRMRMLNLALQTLWEGLKDHEWTDAQLAEFNEELAKLDFLADYEFSMRTERAVKIAWIEYLRHPRKSLFVRIGSHSSNPAEDRREEIANVIVHLAPSSVFWQNELVLARAYQQWILPVMNVARHRVLPGFAEAAQANLDNELPSWSPWPPDKMLACATLAFPNGYVETCAFAQSSVDMAQVACALERYRSAQGEYPKTLDVLTPRFIGSLPPDVVGGQPLKYHRTGNGQFTLYSVGWNGKDDGGVAFVSDVGFPFFVDYDKGDWVWSGGVIKKW